MVKCACALVLMKVAGQDGKVAGQGGRNVELQVKSGLGSHSTMHAGTYQWN